MGRRSVLTPSSTPFGWLFLLQFWAADDQCLQSRRNLRLFEDGKIPLWWAFTFLVSDSYGFQQISYLRTISELMALIRSSMFESHLTPPNIPSIRHSLPSAATSSYLSSRRSRTKHKRPSRSAESVRVGISSGENPADWYTNAHQFWQTATDGGDSE